jgi:hypothetical protein
MVLGVNEVFLDTANHLNKASGTENFIIPDPYKNESGKYQPGSGGKVNTYVVTPEARSIAYTRHSLATHAVLLQLVNEKSGVHCV